MKDPVNRAILEFHKPCNWLIMEDEDLDYDTNWASLMEVVAKICELRYQKEQYYLRTFGMQDEEGKVMVRFNNQPLFKADTLIRATYEAVYYFVSTL